MTTKHMYEIFAKEFPWFVPNVVKYQANRKEGGIDIFLDSHSTLNFQLSRTGWILKRGRER